MNGAMEAALCSSLKVLVAEEDNKWVFRLGNIKMISVVSRCSFLNEKMCILAQPQQHGLDVVARLDFGLTRRGGSGEVLLQSQDFGRLRQEGCRAVKPCLKYCTSMHASTQTILQTFRLMTVHKKCSVFMSKIV